MSGDSVLYIGYDAVTLILIYKWEHLGSEMLKISLKLNS